MFCAIIELQKETKATQNYLQKRKIRLWCVLVRKSNVKEEKKQKQIPELESRNMFAT